MRKMVPCNAWEVHVSQRKYYSSYEARGTPRARLHPGNHPPSHISSADRAERDGSGICPLQDLEHLPRGFAVLCLLIDSSTNGTSMQNFAWWYKGFSKSKASV